PVNELPLVLLYSMRVSWRILTAPEPANPTSRSATRPAPGVESIIAGPVAKTPTRPHNSRVLSMNLGTCLPLGRIFLTLDPNLNLNRRVESKTKITSKSETGFSLNRRFVLVLENTPQSRSRNEHEDEQFKVPTPGRKAEQALHEPQSAAGKMPAAPSRCRPFSARFMVPMHAEKRKRDLHEPGTCLRLG